MPTPPPDIDPAAIAGAEPISLAAPADPLPLATRDRLSRRSLLVVLLFASTFLLPTLGGRFRVLTLHEVFAAEPAREMLSGGHWVIPQFAGKPRTVKPPATGWLIAGSMALFGSEAEWVVRLPTALAGVATAGIVAWLAGRWLGDAGGLVAGLMQATFAYVLMQARLAEADMLMCAAVALAMAAFAAGAVERVRVAGQAEAGDGHLRSRDREGAGESSGAVRATGPQGWSSSEVPGERVAAAPSGSSSHSAPTNATFSTSGPAGRSLDPRLPTPPLPHGRGSLVAYRPPIVLRPSLSLALAFHVGTGLAFLFKGVGIVFVLLGCLAWVLVPAVPGLLRRGPWSAVGRRWRPAARLLFHPVGLPLLVAMVAGWPLAAWRQMPDIVAVWRRETVGRATGEFGPPDPWHVYFWSVPYLLLPWLPFAIAGVVNAVRKAGGGSTTGDHDASATAASSRSLSSSRLSFLACWFLAGMTLLTLSSFRHKHYAIPMLPPVTVLAAVGFADWLRRAPRRKGNTPGTRELADAGGAAGSGRAWLPPVAIALVVGAVAVGGLLAFGKQAKFEMAATAALVAVGVAATAGLYFAGRTRAVVIACFGTALVGGLAFQGLILPKFDDYRASADLARRANVAVPAGATVYLVALGEAHPAFYVTHPLVRVDRRKDIAGFVRDAAADRDAYALCPASAVHLLAEAGDVAELDRVDHLRRTEKDPTVLVKVRAKLIQTRPAQTQPATP